MKIGELTKQDIGSELTRLASLTGMKLPDDPPLTAHWIQKKFYNYYAALLREGFDWYCEGHLDLKSREVNAMNISRILHTFMKSSKNRYYEIKPNPIQHEIDKKKEDDVSKRALSITAEQYWIDMESDNPTFKLSIRTLISLESYVVEKGWVVRGEITDEIRKDIIGRLKVFEDRKQRYIAQGVKDKSDFHARTWTNFIKEKPVSDYERAVVTAYLIEKRIKDGWEPKL